MLNVTALNCFTDAPKHVYMLLIHVKINLFINLKNDIVIFRDIKHIIACCCRMIHLSVEAVTVLCTIL